MKIYTKTGDKGTSGLFGGQRVPKTHPRLAAYGTVDELNSMLGVLTSRVTKEAILKELYAIQSDLLTIGSLLASPNTKDKLPESLVTKLEQSIDVMTAELPELKQFILPGGSPAAATAHLARTICRRAEREIVALTTIEPIDPLIVTYVNRLSDWLFTLARYLNKLDGGTEQLWVK